MQWLTERIVGPTHDRSSDDDIRRFDRQSARLFGRHEFLERSEDRRLGITPIDTRLEHVPNGAQYRGDCS